MQPDNAAGEFLFRHKDGYRAVAFGMVGALECYKRFLNVAIHLVLAGKGGNDLIHFGLGQKGISLHVKPVDGEFFVLGPSDPVTQQQERRQCGEDNLFFHEAPNTANSLNNGRTIAMCVCTN